MQFLLPICPGIFFPLNVLPGSYASRARPTPTCRCPVEPNERCDTLTPCEAPKPAKPQRRMTPWKPLPCE